LGGDNTVHKTNTQLWRGTIAKNGAENNIVSYQYITSLNSRYSVSPLDAQRALNWQHLAEHNRKPLECGVTLRGQAGCLK